MRKNWKKANDTSSGGNTVPDPKCRIENYNFSLPLPPSYFCIRGWYVWFHKSANHVKELELGHSKLTWTFNAYFFCLFYGVGFSCFGISFAQICHPFVWNFEKFLSLNFIIFYRVYTLKKKGFYSYFTNFNGNFKKTTTATATATTMWRNKKSNEQNTSETRAF